MRLSGLAVLGAYLALSLVAATAMALELKPAVSEGSSGSSVQRLGSLADPSWPLTLHGSTVGTLYPGTTVPISFTVDNLSSSHQQLGTIYLGGVKACTGTGSSWDPWLNDGAGGCSNGGTEQTSCESVDPGNAGDANLSSFYMADVAENQEIAGSSNGVSATNGGTLKMNNLASSHDGCEHANLYLQLATR
jgi:hypothetical protein